MHTGLHVGAVMSVASSSTGRLFAAYTPEDEVKPMLARDIVKRRGEVPNDVLEGVLAEVRQRRMARTLGLPIPGIDSLSAPVFNQAGRVALGVTVFGPTEEIDVSWEGEIAGRLVALTAGLSLANVHFSPKR
jgi:DNA-binding IclR family transcriptional regulator